MLNCAAGLFDLNDSDRRCGSFISLQDACACFLVEKSALAHLPWTALEGKKVLDERALANAWSKAEIPDAAPQGKSSWDELILFTLIKRIFKDALVYRQVPVKCSRKKYLVDFRVAVPSLKQQLFIEYDGPHHFCRSRYGTPEDPRKKKEAVQNATGLEVVNWPYWIQRCRTNVLALFDRSVHGYGALWSTSALFGQFVFPDSAALIERFTARFNAVDQDGYGYFYGPETRGRLNPAHPVLAQIQSGQGNKQILLPPGYTNENRWLPSALQHRQPRRHKLRPNS